MGAHIYPLIIRAHVNVVNKQEAVRVLRRGGCFSECNRRQCVLEVVHELHQAQFHAFLELYRKEPAVHHALHLAKVAKPSHGYSGACQMSRQDQTFESCS